MRLWSFEMGEKSVYGGKGVVKAVENINNLLAPELLGFDTRKEMDIDNIMLELDGTANKGKCGANATLGVSVSLC
jgi:enolase